MTWVSWLGVFGTALGIVLTAANIYGKIKDKAREEGSINTRLALIIQSVNNIEKGQSYTTGKVDTLEKTVSDHSAAIAAINESAKSAHHRIDEIRNKLNLEESK